MVHKGKNFKMSILIVDDNTVNLFVIQKILKTLDMRTVPLFHPLNSCLIILNKTKISLIKSQLTSFFLIL